MSLTSPRAGAAFQIIFEGIAGSSFTGDIAIDDIYFTEGPCNRESFEFDNVSEDPVGKYWTILEITSWKVRAYGIFTRVGEVSEIERVSAANE